jgi:two-component sensor histidine kinase
MDSPHKTRPARAGWRTFVVVLGIMTLMMLLSAAENYASQLVTSTPVPWTLALRRAVEEWGLWTIIALGVLAFCDRHPFDLGNLRRGLLIHGPASLVVALVDLTLLAWILHGQRSVDGTVFLFPVVFKKLLIHYLVLGMVFYWVIVLAHTGWLYYRRFRERERQATALSVELVQARLDALRMQLNPHFLFNTLHTISALIHEQPATADRMVVRLSDLLRQTLDQAQTQEVPLRQELAFLDGFLDIEKTRFQERLTVVVNVEPGLDEVLVPFLLLQPLVENAIRHGIEPLEAGGRIEITARRIAGQLELAVTDNGPGVPETPAARSREGVGLTNVRSRAAHLYGRDHQFSLTPAPGGGSRACLRLPCRTSGQAKATVRIAFPPQTAAGCCSPSVAR